MTDPVYAVEPGLEAAEFGDLLIRSTLAERRPKAAERQARMLAGANLIVTARIDGRLVGVARSLTDFAYCCYLSDLAVDAGLQRGGIGRGLIERTQAEAGPECSLILLSAPAAMEYYPKVGFRAAGNCFVIDRER